MALLARIGNDDFGRMALDLWRTQGIDASLVEVAAGERSGVAQIQGARRLPACPRVRLWAARAWLGAVR